MARKALDIRQFGAIVWWELEASVIVLSYSKIGGRVKGLLLGDLR